MPKNRTRAQVIEGVKYLRDKKGRFAGSVGGNRDPLEGLSPRQRKRLRAALKGRRGQKRPTAAPTEAERYELQLKELASKPSLTTADRFNKKLAETRLAQLRKEENKPVPTSPEPKRGIVITGDRLPKVLNPQEHIDAVELPPQVLSPVTRTKLHVGAAGFRAEVSYDKTFSVEVDSNFRYKVEHNGKEVLLNDNVITMRFQGEVVKGVPNIVGSLKDTDNETLTQKIALAEVEVKKGRAPIWNVDEHGRIVDDPELVGKSRAADGIDYRGMQIHHVGQWAKHTPADIEADFKAGKIDATERERRYLDTIEVNKYKDEKNTAEYMLKLKPKGEREFVILPGGLHQGGTPLYTANHPYFYDPSKGKFGAIGIPKQGDSSRQWFNSKFRGQFWKEYAKYQLQLLSDEANRRIKSGDLTATEAQTLYQKAVDKVKAGELVW